MERSLSKVINTIKTWCLAHPQIETFESKPLTEFVAQDQRKYPLVWLDYSGISPAAARGLWTISMPFYILDRVERDYSNLDAVMSSTLLIVDDLLTIYNDNSCYYGFDFQDGASVSPWMLEFDDLVCGWQVSPIVQIGMSRSELSIPS